MLLPWTCPQFTHRNIWSRLQGTCTSDRDSWTAGLLAPWDAPRASMEHTGWAWPLGSRPKKLPTRLLGTRSSFHSPTKSPHTFYPRLGTSQEVPKKPTPTFISTQGLQHQGGRRAYEVQQAPDAGRAANTITNMDLALPPSQSRYKIQ